MNFGLKGMKAEEPRPQSLAYPTLQLVQPLLSFSSQGPSLGSLVTFWALGTSLNRNLLLQMRAQCQEGREKGNFRVGPQTIPTQFSHCKHCHTPKKTGLTHRPHQSWETGSLAACCWPASQHSGGHMCWGISLEATKGGKVALPKPTPTAPQPQPPPSSYHEFLTPKHVAK